MPILNRPRLGEAWNTSLHVPSSPTQFVSAGSIFITNPDGSVVFVHSSFYATQEQLTSTVNAVSSFINKEQ